MISLWGVDLASVAPLQLSTLVHAVTQGVRIHNVAGASHFSVQTLLLSVLQVTSGRCCSACSVAGWGCRARSWGRATP